MSESDISLSAGLPETVLPPVPAEWSAALDAASGSPADVAAVAARYPRYLEAWATLAEMSDDPVASYAYARVGYHRGLDALRGAGWRGSGYVRWSEQTNLGFLRSLDALRKAAGVIGERDEEERCEVFLRQLDPRWRPGP